MGLVAARPRLPRRTSASAAREHGALLVLRRGDHRVPASVRPARRCASGSRPTCRSSARSSAAASRSPRSAGAPTSWTTSPRSAPCTRRARCRGNPLATAAGLAALAQLDAARYAALEAHGGAASSTACATRSTHAGIAVQVAAGGDARRAVLLGPARSPTTTPRSAADHERYARVLPRHARPRRVPRAERLRDDVREPRAHRRRISTAPSSSPPMPRDDVARAARASRATGPLPSARRERLLVVAARAALARRGPCRRARRGRARRTARGARTRARPAPRSPPASTSWPSVQPRGEQQRRRARRGRRRAASDRGGASHHRSSSDLLGGAFAGGARWSASASPATAAACLLQVALTPVQAEQRQAEQDRRTRGTRRTAGPAASRGPARARAA